MTTAAPSESPTRDHIVQLLSHSEFASVGSDETKAQLRNGDEYLDLDQLDQGVQRARAANAPTGSILLRKAIYEDTWRRVLRQLRAKPQ